ncbi:MAG TPA: DNA polymerase III subunit gamma/tau [Casimicrobiaceae bacterium]|nr:DNA polymerase III subunit gamma/tau [Casimicrobiaceae bacterium]
MSYQVLARKWRPKTFAELTGQGHVVTALQNALARGRLHHAYLLTGTRGVGKTTIARILAKSLNCLTHGVSPTPCGTCAACVDIDAGRFVDLLEIDAASNTGIDNMREILDNARYAPTVGRYKVYLIDEVHMLSKSAFNSMLKTLEEPPEHVKFVLATTDPQKVPVTVLSRCLQFALKPLAPDEIGARLAFILREEGIAHDADAVALIARAASGSLRDGLSLLDQAIAFGGGEVRGDAVRTMLGVVDRDVVYRIADALAAGDGAALIAQADAIAARGLSADDALAELAALMHRVAVAQAVPQAAESYDDGERIAGYAARFPPEAVQLLWQIAAQGRADLPIAPDEAMGLSMTLLRMLAFEPAGATSATPGRPPRAETPPRIPRAETPGATAAPSAPAAQRPLPVAAATARIPLPSQPSEWPGFVASLGLTGMARELAAQTEMRRLEGGALTLALPAAHQHLAGKPYADRLKAALEQATGARLLLAFEVGEAATDSLAERNAREKSEAKARHEAAFRDEPFVRDVVTRFDARVRPDSIKPR